MKKTVSFTKDIDALLPACIKIVTHRIIEVCDQFYLFIENVYGDTYLFKIVSYVKPSEQTKETIENILGGYAA